MLDASGLEHHAKIVRGAPRSCSDARSPGAKDSAQQRVGREDAARKEEALMSIITWVLLGLISGFIASRLVNKHGQGVFMDVLIGVVGALAGGFIFNLAGATGVTGFNLWSLFVSVVGSVLLLVIYHAIANAAQRHHHRAA
jgi:uncharacterized membrane protein YeaQ/YmgE (transglycosylase-associated protein family)